MIRRRALALTAACATAPWPTLALERPRVVWVGFDPLSPNDAPVMDPWREAFRSAGYTDGANISLEYQYVDAAPAGRAQRLDALLTSLVRDRVDVLFAGAMLHDGGVTSHFDCGFVLPSRDELEVVGEEGSLFLDDPWHAHEPLIEIRRDDGVERVEVERANSYQLELENLSEAIRGEAELLLGRADAVGNAGALEALYASAAGG